MQKASVRLAIASVLTACAAGSAQSQSGLLPELRVELIAAGQSRPSKYVAELKDLHYGQKIGSAELPPDDTWRFRDVPYGDYRLTITEGTGIPLYDQIITVGPQNSTIMVRLPKTETPHAPSGTVSMWQLRNPVPRKALQSFSVSQKFFDAGDYEKAAHELAKAIKISPSYAQAYSTLAVVHMRIGFYQQAISEISRAMDIAGPTARDLSNKALAEYKLERYADSIQSARSALKLDPNHGPAHYVLGVILAMDKNTMVESVAHLEQAARTIDGAKAVLKIVQKSLGRE
jgi:tetratricopeptide (TPR) repeat protein